MTTAAEFASRRPFYAWFVVALLALANCVSFIDRLLLSLVVAPIKTELQLADWQVGLLQGLAFATFYCVIGLAVARIADIASRKWIITAGVSLWCVMTALTAMARSFGQLFVTRAGVAVGEATLTPATHALLAGYFPRERLALAIGIYSAGVTAGMGLAYLVGGAAINWVGTLGSVDVPLLGTLSGWRLVFALVGALGLPVAVATLAVVEPTRPIDHKAAPIRQVFGHFRLHLADYGLVFAGYGATTITVYAFVYWAPTFFQRHYHTSITVAASLLGTAALIGGLLGAFCGGALSDRLERAGDHCAKLRVLWWCCAGLVAPTIVAPFMPSAEACAAVLSLTFFFGSASTGPAGAYVQSITPQTMRAQFGAAYQLSLTLVGAVLGPFAVAAFTDFVFQDESRVGWSLACVAALANPMAAWLTWRAFMRARRAAPALGSRSD
ncbi:MAG: MFS transporter [Steroidobacteraceae bacterium]